MSVLNLNRAAITAAIGWLLAGGVASAQFSSCGSAYCASGSISVGTTTAPASGTALQVNGGLTVTSSSSGDTMATITQGGDASSGTLTIPGDYPNLLLGGNRGLTTDTSSGWLTLYNQGGPIGLQQGSPVTAYLEINSAGLWAIDNTYLGLVDGSSGYGMWDFVWNRPSGGNGHVAMGISMGGNPYAGGNLLFVAGGNESGTNGAYNHTASTDPTLFIHSHSAATTETTEWMSFHHDTTNGMIQTGKGSLILSPATGIVGIGTSTPCSSGTLPTDCLLSVNGGIRANEVVVTTTGADYVFDPDYKLAPLSDVAAYIAANHHLPGVPSAEEMKEKGASVSEMQSKLLAKVEELTLHLIQDEEKIAGLEKSLQKDETSK